MNAGDKVHIKGRRGEWRLVKRITAPSGTGWRVARPGRMFDGFRHVRDSEVAR